MTGDLVRLVNDRIHEPGPPSLAEFDFVCECGTSLVLCPGRLDRGRYALIDFHNSAVEFGKVAARASG